VLPAGAPADAPENQLPIPHHLAPVLLTARRAESFREGARHGGFDVGQPEDAPASAPGIRDGMDHLRARLAGAGGHLAEKQAFVVGSRGRRMERSSGMDGLFRLALGNFFGETLEML